MLAALQSTVLGPGVVTDAKRDPRGQGEGDPQGSPISPVLANLFMHYAFDRWMDREHSGCPFERYADDIVAHCDSEQQAHTLRAAIAERLESLGLELHPEKTKIVFCKDANRAGSYQHTSFDFERDLRLGARLVVDGRVMVERVPAPSRTSSP